MLHSIEVASSQVLALLNGGRCDAISGGEITIRNAWCAHGRQIGTGCDEHGRPVVFSISLATGEGIARVM